MALPDPIECKYFDKFRYSMKVPTFVKKKKHFNIFQALLSVYDVLDKVFDFLSFKDLQNLAEASDMLRNIVAETLRRRLSPVLFALDTKCRLITGPFDINPSMCMVFNCSYSRASSPINFATIACLHSEKKEARKPMIELLERDLLPVKCAISSLCCRQVSSTFTDNCMFNGFIFPKIPNVTISMFRISEQHKKIHKTVEDNIGKDNNLVCLLTYALRTRPATIYNLIDKICHRQPGVKFALGGGFVVGMQTFNEIDKKPFCRKTDLLCISFSIPKDTEVSFNAYSVVIPKEATSAEKIQECLVQLKANYTPRKYGIIYRITCISRQKEISTETALLRKIFPDIEVIGFSGDGEIGWNCYDNCDEQEYKEEEPPKKKKGKVNANQKKIHHQLTTIIILITWGKMKK